MQAKYSRVLLKLSGEALAGDQHFGLNSDVILNICKYVKICADMGVQIGIVVGGGNFWRGRSSEGMDRTTADHIGMLATQMNALAVADGLKQLGAKVRVMSAVQMGPICETYSRNEAVRLLEDGNIVVFGCGTGNPFCSTDSAASLRAVEINANVMLKATMVDGVYDSDPKTNPNAVKYDTLSFDEVLAKNLKVMDSSAASMCRENKMSILVFNLEQPENMVKVMQGENVGTVVTP